MLPDKKDVWEVQFETRMSKNTFIRLSCSADNLSAIEFWVGSDVASEF